MQDKTIAFIGCGNMARSILVGLLQAKCSPSRIWATNRTAARNEALKATFGVHVTSDNLLAIREADVVILGVKPQAMRALCQSIQSTIQEAKPLVISLAAGVRMATLESYLGQSVAIVRSMPNVPAVVGAGMAGLFANDQVDALARDVAESIHRAVGVMIWLDKESDIDIVAALSGSGPAYFFYFIEQLTETAVQFGLSSEHANLLAVQTAFGAGKCVLESTEPVGELRRQVTSPNGSTEKALAVLMASLPSAVEQAMQAAIERAQQMAKEVEQEEE